MNIVIRTETNELAAAGHVMRCFSIAEAIQEENDVDIKIISEFTPLVGELSKQTQINHGVAKYDGPPETAADARTVLEEKPSLVVADSFGVTQDWIDTIENENIPVIRLAGSFNINSLSSTGAVFPEPCNHERAPDDNFVCGIEYIPLSKKYWYTNKRPKSDIVKNIVITTGGSDHYDLCSVSICALDEVYQEQLNVSVIIGPFFKNIKSIEKYAKQSHHNIQLIHQPNGLYEYLKYADLCISGGGGTLYEMACMGVPGIGITIWPLQASVVDYMATKNTILGVTYTETNMLADLVASLNKLDPSLLQKMSEMGKQVIDGQGALRIAKYLLERGKVRSV